MIASDMVRAVSTNQSVATRTSVHRVLAWLGLALHIAIGIFPFAPSGVVLAGAPFIAVWVLWVGGLALVIMLVRRRAPYTVVVPASCLVGWLAVVAAFGSA